MIRSRRVGSAHGVEFWRAPGIHYFHSVRLEEDDCRDGARAEGDR